MLPDRSRAVRVPRPYSLSETLRLQRLGHGDPTWRMARDEAAHALRTPDGPVTVRLVQQDDVVHAETWGPGGDWADARLHAWLGLDDVVDDFRPEHPRVRELWSRSPGLRLPVSPDLTDMIVRGVLQQRVTWDQATRSWRAMVRAFGAPAPGPFGLLLPPDPECAHATGYAGYHPFGVEQKRANLIRELYRRHRQLDALTAVPRQDALRRLAAQPGLGPWTVALVAVSALGEPDMVPLGDYNLPSTVAWVLADEPRADDARMIELLEPFRPHRGRVVRLLLTGGIQAPRRGPGLPSGWAPGA